MGQEILIIGAGPAGSAAAISLSRYGFKVCIMERGSILSPNPIADFKIGESLPPAAMPLLQQLAVWEDFERSDHLKCYGNHSYWGSDTPGYTDFITQPPGYGWHIDRRAFEQMLLHKAQACGVIVREQIKLKEAHFRNHRWRVAWTAPDGTAQQEQFDFIVDASGRHSWLARRLEIDRLYEDSQLALVTFLQSRQQTPATSSLIETTERGWWYSAPIPQGRLATAFLCKPDKRQRAEWRTEKGWWKLLAKARHTSGRIQEVAAHWISPPQFVAADSGILESTYGSGWLAVGDAAMTYDPVASHGIMMALVSARDAAKAISRFLEGSPAALEQYDRMLRGAYYRYVQQRRIYYQAEQRFETQGYW